MSKSNLTKSKPGESGSISGGTQTDLLVLLSPLYWNAEGVDKVDVGRFALEMVVGDDVGLLSGFLRRSVYIHVIMQIF